MNQSKIMTGMTCILPIALGACVARQSEARRQVEGQQSIHAMLELLPMPPEPTAASCSSPDAERPVYLCLADAHAASACARQGDDDMRPYTLCLAETYGDDVEAELKRQLEAKSALVKANIGVAGLVDLEAKQREWETSRHQTCAAEAEGAPVSEQARAELTCLVRLAAPRIAYLKTAMG